MSRASAEAERQRLLAQHMLAGLQRGDALLGMQGRRHAEVHQFDLGVRQHLAEGAIDLYVSAQVDVSGAGDVADHARAARR